MDPLIELSSGAGKRSTSGTCVVCMTRTDTAVAFIGEPLWSIAGMIGLGIPKDQAIALVKMVPPFRTNEGPYGDEIRIFRVCGDCTDRVDLPRPGPLKDGDVPLVHQPDDLRGGRLKEWV